MSARQRVGGFSVSFQHRVYCPQHAVAQISFDAEGAFGRRLGTPIQHVVRRRPIILEGANLRVRSRHFVRDRGHIYFSNRGNTARAIVTLWNAVQ